VGRHKHRHTNYAEAKASGQRFYHSDRPCRNGGHTADRYVSTLACTECHKARAIRNADKERTRKRLQMRRRRLDPAVREYQRQYQKDHPEQTNARVRQRYARRLAGFVEDVSLEYLIERDEGRCQLCGDQLVPAMKFPHPKSITQDHIIPLSKGGTHERTNLQLACLVCNQRKNNRMDYQGAA
jgi:5-methylcytosine-specific restriction endonuclease McrA